MEIFKNTNKIFQQWLQELQGTLLYIVRLQQVTAGFSCKWYFINEDNNAAAVKNNCKPHKTEILPRNICHYKHA